MSTITRFFGEQDPENTRCLVANPKMDGNPLSLQILFPKKFHLSELGLTKSLRKHPLSSKTARIEIEQECATHGTPLGLAGWDDHVIQIIGFDAPIPHDELAFSLQVSHCDAELKEQAAQHQSHILLYYAGYDENPICQYEALAILAGAFANAGALMVVNLLASSAIPARMISPEQNPMLEKTFTQFLLSILFIGFVKYFTESRPDGWVRTMGADALFLPNLAAYLEDMNNSEHYFKMFTNIHDYVCKTGNYIQAGDTMQLNSKEHIKTRLPTEKEYFLENNGSLLVIEKGSELESKRVQSRLKRQKISVRK